jgi:hypothetical protein
VAKKPKPAKGRTVPLDKPRAVATRHKLVAVVTWYPSGPLVERQPALVMLNAAECMEAAAAMVEAWPGPESLTHEEAYQHLVRAGMPDGGLLK